MSFKDCLDTAVVTGKIKQEKADEAKKLYDEAYDEAVAEGLGERAAGDSAAIKAVDRLAEMTFQKKWQKVHEIRTAAKIWDEFSTTNKPVEAIIKLGDQIDLAKERLMGQMHKLVERNLDKWRPRAAGLIQPIQDMNDIVYSAYGQKVQNVSSKEMFEEIANLQEWTRKRAMMEGAFIPENKERRLPQGQDRMKLWDLHNKMGPAPAKQQWINDMMRTLDWEIMRFEGRQIPEHKRPEVLARSYSSILTQGTTRLKPGHTGAEGLATKMARERFFYYKDADSWIEMQEKYGAGNVWLQVVSYMETMARDIATMEHLGPNPLIMKNYVNNVARKRAGEIDEGKAAKRTMVSKVDKELGVFEERYKIHNHLVNNGAESLLAQAIAPVRTFVVASVLTKAFISNLGDLGIGKNTLMYYKLPHTGYMRSVVKAFAEMPSKERRLTAIRNGLGMESATSMALMQQRYLGGFDGPNWTKRMSDVSFRATWLTPWTQASRWAFGHHVMGVLADSVGKEMDELPFAPFMREAGITPDEWDMMRAVPLFDDGGAPKLRPIDMLEQAGVDSVVRQRVADKFTDFILDMQRRGVPSVDTRIAASLGAGVDASRATGQVIRTFGVVKSFPTLIWMLHLRDALAAPTVGGKLGNVARFVTILTLAGAFITQMKELVNGRDPRDMTDPGFWIRSLLNGGSLGFAGDALFSRTAAFRGGGLPELFAGPVPQFAEDVKGLADAALIDALEGKGKLPRELVEFGTRYTPIPWQARLMLERALLEDLLKMADPTAHRRLKQRETRRLREMGQRSWWRPGDRTPHRAPSLGAAVGMGPRR